ncbi:hypothetical protein VFPFJ_05074 [Purpureocillium lilacinum]|uniref:Uncharacterized protein n=1 Tax=Purpureocillium lilacinum TaxID=33203 RepID=A0A179HKJ7_PURLI|nr:hypothetical protein VFPFJ_05074 [Purpureocillium lilacinum]OAQ90915.1 hypothetical protein VFPFJ_05074 [Purpureocillium lilacinum]
MTTSRWRWRMYCNTEIGCKYGNTKDKDAFFKHFGHKKARKVRPCLIKTSGVLGASSALSHTMN